MIRTVAYISAALLLLCIPYLHKADAQGGFSFAPGLEFESSGSSQGRRFSADFGPYFSLDCTTDTFKCTVTLNGQVYTENDTVVPTSASDLPATGTWSVGKDIIQVTADADSANDVTRKSYVDAHDVTYLRGSTRNVNPGNGENVLVVYTHNTGTSFNWANTVAMLAGDSLTCTDLAVEIVAFDQESTEETSKITLFKNGAATALWCTIDTTTTTSTCSETGSVSYATNDTWYFKVECTGVDCPVSKTFGANISMVAKCTVTP